MKYDAFLSYPHKSGMRLSIKVQEALQLIAKPWFKSKALNIFRDETNLSTSPHLWKDIEKALASSEHFIIIGTEDTSKSKWILEEVNYWVKYKSVQNIHLVWVGGNFIVDDSIKKIIWEKTNTLPNVFQEIFKEIPNYIDLRDFRDVADLSINNIHFKKAMLKLASAIHGKPIEVLDSEHFKQHKRLILFRRSAYSLISISIFAVIVLLISIINKNKALSTQVDFAKIMLNDYYTNIKNKNNEPFVVYNEYGKISHYKEPLINVFYDYDKFNIRSDQVKYLDILIAFLNDHPSISIIVTSKEFYSKEDEYSNTLSEQRASSLSSYIISRGIDSNRISFSATHNRMAFRNYPISSTVSDLQAIIDAINTCTSISVDYSKVK